MSKIKILILILIGILFFLILCIYLTKGECLIKIKDFDLEKDGNIEKKVLEQSNFKLESTFMQDSNWEYVITGQLPNPCYEALVDVVVAESYPEQVTVRIEVIPPDADMMCIQVIEDFEYEGSFSASKDAIVNLVVE